MLKRLKDEYNTLDNFTAEEIIDIIKDCNYDIYANNR